MNDISREQKLLKYSLDDFEDIFKDIKLALTSFKMGLEMVERTVASYLNMIVQDKNRPMSDLKDMIGNDVLLISRLIKNLKILENDNNSSIH